MTQKPSNKIATNYDEAKQWIDVINVDNGTIEAFCPCMMRLNNGGLTNSEDDTVAQVFRITDGNISGVDALAVVVNSQFDILAGGRGRVSLDYPLVAKVPSEVGSEELMRRPLYPHSDGFKRHPTMWPSPKLFGPSFQWWMMHPVESDDDDVRLAMVDRAVAVADSSLNIVSVVSDWFTPTESFSAVDLVRFPDVDLPVNEVANFGIEENTIELRARGTWDIHLTVKLKAKFTGPNPVSENIPGFKLGFAIEQSPDSQLGSLKTTDDRIMMFPVVGIDSSTSYGGVSFIVGDVIESYGINFAIDTREDLDEIYKTKLSCSAVRYPNILANDFDLSVAVRALVVFRPMVVTGA